MNKATKERNALVIALAEAEGIQFFSFPDSRVTIAIRREGPLMVKFATAIASLDEPKFRKNVGRIIALNRLDCGGGMPAVCPKWYEDSFAEGLVDIIGDPSAPI